MSNTTKDSRRPASNEVTLGVSEREIVSKVEKGVLCLTAKSKVRLLPALNIPMDILMNAISIIKEACI